jgi:hydrogenase maturation protein HypF
VLREIYGDVFAERDIPLIRHLPPGWELALEAAAKGINAPLASGAGRLFDIAAAILGVRTVIHYEGQAAVELELAAAGHTGYVLPYTVTDGPVPTLDFLPTFAVLAEKGGSIAARGELAAAFHLTLATAVADMVRRLAKLTGIRKVALSGGVFQNMTLLEQVVSLLEDEFTLLLHRQVPPNDGGLSLGQAAVARERSK